MKRNVLLIILTSFSVWSGLTLFVTKAKLAKTEANLSETKDALFKLSGLLGRGSAPVNEWSKEIKINGHPFHIWTANQHRHYKVMINGIVDSRVIEEGETPNFPDNIQTIRLMTVEGNEPIFFEIPAY